MMIYAILLHLLRICYKWNYSKEYDFCQASGFFPWEYTVFRTFLPIVFSGKKKRTVPVFRDSSLFCMTDYFNLFNNASLASS